MSFTKVQYVDTETVIHAANLNDIQNCVLDNEKLRKCLVVSVAAFSSLPQTVSNSNITADMVVIHAEIGTPSAMPSDWTWTTAAGKITISGTISGSTTLKLYLLPSR